MIRISYERSGNVRKEEAQFRLVSDEQEDIHDKLILFLHIGNSMVARFDDTMEIIEKKNLELVEEDLHKLWSNWTSHLKKIISIGKSWTKIWSEFPEEYGEKIRFYLLQALVWRFL